MTQDMELVRDDERDDVPTLPMVTDEMIRHAEKGIENVRKMQRLALKITNANDWVDFGGKPYLTEGGCARVAALFGVSFEQQGVQELREDIAGRTIRRYNASVRATMGRRFADGQGGASSDDPFFGMRGGQPIPLEDVNLNNVRKKAVTNAQMRAVKALLCLDNMTWDDVRAAGVDRGTISGVQFKGKSAGGSTADSSAKVQLKQALIQLAALTGQDARQVLRDASRFVKNGTERWADDVDRMSDGWIAATLPKVQKAIDDQLGGGIPDEPREPGAEG